MKKALILSMVLLVAVLVVSTPSAQAAYVETTSFQNLVSGALTAEMYWDKSDAGLPYKFAYCVDPTASMPWGYPTRYNIVQLAPSTDGMKQAVYLMNNYGYSMKGLLPGYTDPVKSGVVVQLAIWEAIGKLPTVVTGYESLFADAHKLYTDNMSNKSTNGVVLQFYDTAGNRYQDGVTPVPIPPTLFLLGAGLIGAGVIRKRIK